MYDTEYEFLNFSNNIKILKFIIFLILEKILKFTFCVIHCTASSI